MVEFQKSLYGEQAKQLAKDLGLEKDGQKIQVTAVLKAELRYVEGRAVVHVEVKVK